jgi:REP element-mobilizing transposase RayT
MELYPQRKRLRLKGRNYSDPGYYFVTVCSSTRRPIFGTVKFDRVALSSLGQLVESSWRKIPAIFPGVELGTFVVMPNHLHALILLPTILPGKDARQWSLTTIIGNFKAAVTKRTHVTRLWQRSFYDRIVRNQEELDSIRGYILMNPERWAGDRFNPQAIMADDDFLLSDS